MQITIVEYRLGSVELISFCRCLSIEQNAFAQVLYLQEINLNIDIKMGDSLFFYFLFPVLYECVIDDEWINVKICIYYRVKQLNIESLRNF